MKKDLSHKKEFIISLIVCIGLFSGCNNNKNWYPYKTRLLQQNACSDSVKAFEINYYADSILMSRLLITKDSTYVSIKKRLLKKDDGFYEFKEYVYGNKDTITIDTVKLFGLSDTSFIYTVPNDAMVLLGLESYEYVIKKIGENQFLSEQKVVIIDSMYSRCLFMSVPINEVIDTLWRRQYYYDENYQIIKVITKGMRGNITYE